MSDCVTHLRRRVEQVIRPLIGGKRAGALVAFPNGPNAGDSAIYLGQLACLQSLGISPPCLICDYRTFDRRALKRAVGDRPILLAGGGSFGDLWTVGQEYRERILHMFPDNPVIQLPQTMHFRARSTLDRARAAVDRQSNLTLLWRDERSLELARREFNVASELCPDMAFCLGPLTPPRAAIQPVVWISRTDRERSASPPDDASGVTDWPADPHTPLRRLNYALMGAVSRFPKRTVWRKLLMQTYAPLASQRLNRGLTTLSAGEVVITDRLHGHILAMLLGIPNILIDNSYGKLSSFHDTWTRGLDGVRFAGTPAKALSIAEGMLGNPVAVGNHGGGE